MSVLGARAITEPASLFPGSTGSAAAAIEPKKNPDRETHCFSAHIGEVTCFAIGPEFSDHLLRFAAGPVYSVRPRLPKEFTNRLPPPHPAPNPPHSSHHQQKNLRDWNHFSQQALQRWMWMPVFKCCIRTHDLHSSLQVPLEPT